MKRAILLSLLFLALGAYGIWILLELLGTQQERANVSAEQARAEAAEHAPTPGAAYPRDLEAQLARCSHKVRFHIRAKRDLPDVIGWQRGTTTPELGDGDAVKGGTVRLHNVGPFPANYLAFGSPAPQFFHYSMFERMEVPLVQRHPRTGEPVPGLADGWVVDGKTIWFHLNPKARYSNGRPVRAKDFVLGALLRSQCSNDADWQMLEQGIKDLVVYGDEVVVVRLREACPLSLYLASAILHPAEPGFYEEFGNDYTTRYARRVPPTTGAYVITKIEPGRMIRFERQRDWWGDSIHQRRHTCNVDTIEHHFLTDEAQAWEQFLHGRLDALQTRNIVAWQQKLEGVDAVEEGRIIRHVIPVDYPMPPYGIALNAGRLADISLRRGIMHALDMDSAIRVIFRGEARPLTTFCSGYGKLSPKETPCYSYNPEQARAFFAQAGYTQAGPDGVLRKEDGTRLSLKLLYTPSDKTNTLFTQLAQSARACGLEIVADAEPWQNVADKVNAGGHELLFWAAEPSALMPQPERFLHSKAKGTDAPFLLQSQEMDAALKACYTAKSEHELAEACAKVDKMVYDLAIWLPGWKEDRAHIAAWHRVHFPKDYSGPYDVMEAHTFWVVTHVEAPVRPEEAAPAQEPETAEGLDLEAP